VKPGTSIGLNIREEFLLVKINKFFDEIGSIYTSPSLLINKLVEWKVFKFSKFFDNKILLHILILTL
jgi:hypothetical protein